MSMLSPKRPGHLEVKDLGVGVGLRPRHYQEILSEGHPVGFFEAISENYMSGAAKPLYFLDQVRERYPVVLHGVSLSIGAAEEPDREYLTQLKKLVDRVDPPWVTDHFCFSSVGRTHLHDLLPLPYTEEMVRRVARRARFIQDYLGRPFGLENTSSYLAYTQSEMSEWEFIRAVLEEGDIGLLFDVNNVFVSSFNHDFSALEFIREVPHERILQIHMAGHTHHGTHIIDTHVGPCPDPVIRLYEETIRLAGPISTLVEWDDQIPPLSQVLDEALRLGKSRARALESADFAPLSRSSSPLSTRRTSPASISVRPLPEARVFPEPLSQLQAGLCASILRAEPLALDPEERSLAELRFTGNARLTPVEQIEIYRCQFVLRHVESLQEDYPGLLALYGEDPFEKLVLLYLASHPPSEYSLRSLGWELPRFLRDQFKKRAQDGDPPLPNMAGLDPLAPEEKAAFVLEMAELERAYLRAFDAPQTSYLEFSDLLSLSPEAWTSAKFTLAPSVSLLTFDYPVADVRRASRRETPWPPLSPAPRRLIIYRHRDLDLYDKELSKEAFELLLAFSAGQRFGEACEEVATGAEGAAERLESGLGPWFREWTELGLFSAF